MLSAMSVFASDNICILPAMYSSSANKETTATINNIRQSQMKKPCITHRSSGRATAALFTTVAVSEIQGF